MSYEASSTKNVGGASTVPEVSCKAKHRAPYLNLHASKPRPARTGEEQAQFPKCPPRPNYDRRCMQEQPSKPRPARTCEKSQKSPAEPNIHHENYNTAVMHFLPRARTWYQKAKFRKPRAGSNIHHQNCNTLIQCVNASSRKNGGAEIQVLEASCM